MPKTSEEKKAEIIVAIDREIEKRATIVQTLYDELIKYAKAYPDILYQTYVAEGNYRTNVTKGIRFRLAQKDATDTVPKSIYRIYQNYDLIIDAAQNLPSDNSTGDFRGKKAKKVESLMQPEYEKFFVSVDKAIELIKNDRSGREVVIDFLKSAVNQIIYLLSFTTYPGFFRTSTKPLEDIKVAARKAIELRRKLVQLEELDNELEASLNFTT